MEKPRHRRKPNGCKPDGRKPDSLPPASVVVFPAKDQQAIPGGEDLLAFREDNHSPRSQDRQDQEVLLPQIQLGQGGANPVFFSSRPVESGKENRITLGQGIDPLPSRRRRQTGKVPPAKKTPPAMKSRSKRP